MYTNGMFSSPFQVEHGSLCIPINQHLAYYGMVVFQAVAILRLLPMFLDCCFTKIEEQAGFNWFVCRMSKEYGSLRVSNGGMNIHFIKQNSEEAMFSLEKHEWALVVVASPRRWLFALCKNNQCAESSRFECHDEMERQIKNKNEKWWIIIVTMKKIHQWH